MKPPDDPRPSLGPRLHEPPNGPPKIPVLPWHPQTICDENPIKRAPVLDGQRRVQLAPPVALDLDPGNDGPRRREGRLGIGDDVLPERLHDDVRGIVGHDDVAGAEQRGHDGREGGAGTELDGGEAGDGKVAAGRDVHGDLLRGRGGELTGRAQAEGAGLDELSQQQRRVPEEVAEQAAVLVACWVCQGDVQRLGQMWGGVHEALVGGAMF